MESSAVVTSPAVLAAVGRRRVVVVAPTRTTARAALDEIMRQHPDLTARYAPYLMSITLPDGGVIHFESAGSPGMLRGVAADAILVTNVSLLTPDFVERARPALATSLTPSLGVLL